MIEVSIPLEAINKASVREKSIRHGHPSTLHLWWARRPLAACRAVLFAQLVDDPSAWPEHFPTEDDQRLERERLHKIIEDMVPWEASTNQHILNKARYEIARSVAWGLGEEPPVQDDPEAVFAYLQEKAPPVYDPFSGGGSIPLEAQRLGLRAYGSDLNPVAVLISKALVEIPPKFADRSPVNPDHDAHRRWKGAEGLADDVRYYGKWMRDEAEKRIGNLYPKIELEDGTEATVMAWLWARTVASPDPAAKGAHVPLISTFMLSAKKQKKAWVEIVRDHAAQDGWRSVARTGDLTTEQAQELKKGTKSGRGVNFSCSLTGSPISGDYIKTEGKAGRMNYRLLAIVAEGRGGRKYCSPTEPHEQTARSVEPPLINELDYDLAVHPQYMATVRYGMSRFSSLYMNRQLTTLDTLASLVDAAVEHARGADSNPDEDYLSSLKVYLALLASRQANRTSSLCIWDNSVNAIIQVFGRQVIPMTWDFAESNPFSSSSGSFEVNIRYVTKVIEELPAKGNALIFQCDAQSIQNGDTKIIATDPPYYDNVPYADISDFFYVWLRRIFRNDRLDLLRRTMTPKDEELVVNHMRHGEDKEKAEAFFTAGFEQFANGVGAAQESVFPFTVFYAFRQSEKSQEGLTSAGWASILQAFVNAGIMIDGTWPVRTELTGNLKRNWNALASSIVHVCRKREEGAETITRRAFAARLKSEMPGTLQKIRDAGVGPVDIAQSALGPGMGIFTGYAKVLESDDSEMTVRSAIALINQVREEIMGEEDAGYDTPTRFCIDWFQEFGMEPGKSGDAIGMANAYNLSINELERSGVLYAKAGVTRLLQRSEMPEDWTPDADKTLTHWECAQHVIHVLESEDGGSDAAAKLIAAMRPEDAAAARALAYRLYDICEKKGWAQEAQAYNLLAGEFPHLESKALEFQNIVGPAQRGLDLGG